MTSARGPRVLRDSVISVPRVKTRVHTGWERKVTKSLLGFLIFALVVVVITLRLSRSHTSWQRRDEASELAIIGEPLDEIANVPARDTGDQKK